MRQRRWIEVVALVLAAGSLACSFIAGWPGIRGSGHVVEEERSVSGFTGVALSGIGNLYIEVGDEQALRIEAEDNLLAYFETEVRGTTLEIRTRENVNLLPLRPIHFYLTVKALDTIVVSGVETDLLNLTGDATNSNLIGAVTRLQGPLSPAGAAYGNAIVLDLLAFVLLSVGVWLWLARRRPVEMMRPL